MLESIFNRKDNEEKKELINHIKSTNFKYKKELIYYLNNSTNLFCDVNTFKKIITIMNNSKIDLKNTIELAENLYNLTLLATPTEEDINNYYNLYKIMLEYLSLGQTNIDEEITMAFYSIYNSFQNKNLVNLIFKNCFEIAKKYESKNIQNNKAENNNFLLKGINNYINLSRVYYTDEYMYSKNIINLVLKFDNVVGGQFILPSDYTKVFDNLIKERLSFDKKLAGIYDIDEEKLKLLENKGIELEKKLAEIQLLAKQDSENYEKIEYSSKKLLDEIKNIENRILKREEPIEKENYGLKSLDIILAYNHDFQIHTNNSRWICKEVIDKFGAMYISKCDKKQQMALSYVYDNNLINDFYDILCINLDFRFKTDSLKWFNKENIDLFGIDFIVKSEINQFMLSSFFYFSSPQLLKKLLDINPSFNISVNHEITLNYIVQSINNDTVESLGLDYIVNTNIYQQKQLGFFYHNNQINKLKGILDIDLDFCIDIPSFQNQYEVLCDLIKYFNSEDIYNFSSDNNNLEKLANLNKYLGELINTEKFAKMPAKYREEILNIKVNDFFATQIAAKNKIHKILKKVNVDNAKFKH